MKTFVIVWFLGSLAATVALAIAFVNTEDETMGKRMLYGIRFVWVLPFLAFFLHWVFSHFGHAAPRIRTGASLSPMSAWVSLLLWVGLLLPWGRWRRGGARLSRPEPDAELFLELPQGVTLQPPQGAEVKTDAQTTFSARRKQYAQACTRVADTLPRMAFARRKELYLLLRQLEALLATPIAWQKGAQPAGQLRPFLIGRDGLAQAKVPEGTKGWEEDLQTLDALSTLYAENRLAETVAVPGAAGAT